MEGPLSFSVSVIRAILDIRAVHLGTGALMMLTKIFDGCKADRAEWKTRCFAVGEDVSRGGCERFS